MVICKYFLQGTCKFGDMCKFEHEVNDSFKNYQNQNSTSILRQSNFGTSQQMKPANPSNVDTNTLVKSVVNDMTLAEKGGQWLLSCYAPFKEKPAFPGFEDYSFEEIRLGYYEAVKSGTLDQYKQQISMLLQQAIMKIKSLQTPSPDIVNMLKNIYNTPPSSQAGVYGINATSNSFGNSANLVGTTVGQQQSSNFGPPGTSVFAQAQVSQNLFGKPGQSQNNFSTSTNIFGGVPQSTSIFGGSASNSPFGSKQNPGQNSSNNLFGQTSGKFANQGTTSIFGGQMSGQEKAGSFFNSGQNTNNSIFSGTHTNSNIFAPQQTSFPLAAQSQVSNVFGNTNNPVFNQNTTFSSPNNVNTFGQPASPVTSNNIFGATPNIQVSTAFGLPAAQNIPQQASAGIFTSGTNQPQNQIFGNTSKSIFSNQQYQNQNANSPLGLLTKSTMETQNHSASIFGNNQQVGNPNLHLNPLQKDLDLEGIYSKLEDLTEEEIKWFESNDLDILKIPEKPPTFEMCFKK